MKLLFIGVQPSASLALVFSANGFEYTAVDHFPSSLSSKTHDLVVASISQPADLRKFEKLRELFPHAWLVIVIDPSTMKNHRLHNDILLDAHKDDVWSATHWEGFFWLYLQKLSKFRSIETELIKLSEELSRLTTEYRHLSDSSRKLVNQFEKNVELASHIQRSLLPRLFPDIPGVSVAIKFIPAPGGGGDYYDIFEFGDKRRFGVLMADSKTHGMAASLLSVLVKVRLEEMKEKFPDSKSFVEYLNREVHKVCEGNVAPLSLLYAIFDRSTLQFHYTSAGKLKPILWRKRRTITSEENDSPFLGLFDHFGYEEKTLSLEPGDLLILHTDGLLEPLSSGKRAALDQITDILSANQKTTDPLEVQNELLALLDRYKETKPLSDDITVIHFAIQPKALYVAARSQVGSGQ